MPNLAFEPHLGYQSYLDVACSLIDFQQMLAVRRSLTEILLEVTDQEIQTVSQEELARYTAAQGISTHIGLAKSARRPISRPYSIQRETLAY